jgi:ATP adenylyltransferase/5',5'''-P-1,P-4-tetraphosphate phosphorylase II
MSELNSEMVNRLFEEQLSSWKQARDNYEALDRVMTREVNVDGFTFKIQFNPARIVSSAAKVDAKSIKERNCFLCKENRPAVQKGIDFSFDDMDHYTVLINPFPIFKRHLTIPLEEHRDQLIRGRFNVMLELARKLTDFTIFYNGPKCGASAPDHFHFQAGIKGFMPIESSPLNAKTFFSDSEITLEQVVSGLPGIIIMESSSGSKAEDFLTNYTLHLKLKKVKENPCLIFYAVTKKANGG